MSRNRRKILPIQKEVHINAILDCVENNQVTVITGETGCGKSTQVPQILVDRLNAFRVIITCPTRISARSVSGYVAKCRGTKLGEEVGYSIGGDKSVSNTRIEYQTVGVLKETLLHNLKGKNGLNASHVIVDEVHERTIDVDTVLYLLKRLIQKNKRIKIILMSATIQHVTFSDYFRDVPTCSIIPHVNVPTRSYEVKQMLLSSACEHAGIPIERFNNIDRLLNFSNARLYDEIKEVAVELIIRLHRDRREFQNYGFLVFLPGITEINLFHRLLLVEADGTFRNEVEIHVLHSSIPNHEQDKIFHQSSKRKIILSTNIAESSITIEEVKVVIDFCLFKEQNINFHNGAEELKMKWASKESMKQRQGRAGRVREGVCYRMISQRFMRNEMFRSTITPEILRVNLAHLVLKFLKSFPYPENVLKQFITPPNLNNIQRAYADLSQIGAVRIYDTKYELTKRGNLFGELPLNLSNCLLVYYGIAFGLLEECIAMASILDIGGIFFRGGKSPIGNLRKVYEQNGYFDCRSRSDVVSCYLAFVRFVRETNDKVFNERNVTVHSKHRGYRLHLKNFCFENGISRKRMEEVHFKIHMVRERLDRRYPQLKLNVTKRRGGRNEGPRLPYEDVFRIDYRTGKIAMKWMCYMITGSYLNNLVVLSHEKNQEIPDGFDLNRTAVLELEHASDEYSDSRRLTDFIEGFDVGFGELDRRPFDVVVQGDRRKEDRIERVQGGILCVKGRKQAYVQFAPPDYRLDKEDRVVSAESRAWREFLPVQLITKINKQQTRKMAYSSREEEMPYKEAKGPISMYFQGLFYSEKMLVSRFSTLDNFITPSIREMNRGDYCFTFASHTMLQDQGMMFLDTCTMYPGDPGELDLFFLVFGQNIQQSMVGEGFLEVLLNSTAYFFKPALFDDVSMYDLEFERETDVAKLGADWTPEERCKGRVGTLTQTINQMVNYLDNFVFHQTLERDWEPIEKIEERQKGMRIIFISMIKSYSRLYRSYKSQLEKKATPKRKSRGGMEIYGQVRKHTNVLANHLRSDNLERVRLIRYVKRKSYLRFRDVREVLFIIQLYEPEIPRTVFTMVAYVFRRHLRRKDSYFYKMMGEVRSVQNSLSFFFSDKLGISMHRTEKGRKVRVPKAQRSMVKESEIVFGERLESLGKEVNYFRKARDTGRLVIKPRKTLFILPFCLRQLDGRDYSISFLLRVDDSSLMYEDELEDDGSISEAWSLAAKSVFNKIYGKKKGKDALKSKFNELYRGKPDGNVKNERHPNEFSRRNDESKRVSPFIYGEGYKIILLPVPYTAPDELLRRGVHEFSWRVFESGKAIRELPTTMFHVFYNQIERRIRDILFFNNIRVVNMLFRYRFHFMTNRDGDLRVYPLRFFVSRSKDRVRFAGITVDIGQLPKKISELLCEIIRERRSLILRQRRRKTRGRRKSKNKEETIIRDRLRVQFKIINLEKNSEFIRKVFTKVDRLMLSDVLPGYFCTRFDIMRDIQPLTPFTTVECTLKHFTRIYKYPSLHILQFLGIRGEKNVDNENKRLIASALYNDFLYNSLFRKQIVEQREPSESKKEIPSNVTLYLDEIGSGSFGSTTTQEEEEEENEGEETDDDDDDDSDGGVRETYVERMARKRRRGFVLRNKKKKKKKKNEGGSGKRFVLRCDEYPEEFDIETFGTGIRTTYLKHLVHRILREIHLKKMRNYKFVFDVDTTMKKKLDAKDRMLHIGIILGQRFLHYHKEMKDNVSFGYNFSIEQSKRMFSCRVKISYSREMRKKFRRNLALKLNRLRARRKEEEERTGYDHTRRYERMKMYVEMNNKFEEERRTKREEFYKDKKVRVAGVEKRRMEIQKKMEFTKYSDSRRQERRRETQRQEKEEVEGEEEEEEKVRASRGKRGGEGERRRLDEGAKRYNDQPYEGGRKRSHQNNDSEEVKVMRYERKGGNDRRNHNDEGGRVRGRREDNNQNEEGYRRYNDERRRGRPEGGFEKYSKPPQPQTYHSDPDKFRDFPRGISRASSKYDEFFEEAGVVYQKVIRREENGEEIFEKLTEEDSGPKNFRITTTISPPVLLPDENGRYELKIMPVQYYKNIKIFGVKKAKKKKTKKTKKKKDVSREVEKRPPPSPSPSQKEQERRKEQQRSRVSRYLHNRRKEQAEQQREKPVKPVYSNPFSSKKGEEKKKVKPVVVEEEDSDSLSDNDILVSGYTTTEEEEKEEVIIKRVLWKEEKEEEEEVEEESILVSDDEEKEEEVIIQPKVKEAEKQEKVVVVKPKEEEKKMKFEMGDSDSDNILVSDSQEDSDDEMSTPAMFFNAHVKYSSFSNRKINNNKEKKEQQQREEESRSSILKKEVVKEEEEEEEEEEEVSIFKKKRKEKKKPKTYDSDDDILVDVGDSDYFSEDDDTEMFETLYPDHGKSRKMEVPSFLRDEPSRSDQEKERKIESRGDEDDDYDVDDSYFLDVFKKPTTIVERKPERKKKKKKESIYDYFEEDEEEEKEEKRKKKEKRNKKKKKKKSRMKKKGGSSRSDMDTDEEMEMYNSLHKEEVKVKTGRGYAGKTKKKNKKKKKKKKRTSRRKIKKKESDDDFGSLIDSVDSKEDESDSDSGEEYSGEEYLYF